ncbi:MAG: hypothetical protein HKN79_09305 [Flavobacteriales bacterium]|nr:hypothetical protein [Flavobacteriales bacterium]
MKHILLTLFIVSSIGISASAGSDSLYLDKVRTLDGIIENLYGVISGEKGAARDWDLMRYLFHPDAKLIPSGHDKEGNIQAWYLTVEDYIEKSGPWLVEKGFFEEEIHREVDTFGMITQVFSTYEAFNSQADEAPFMRGINSIQLLNDGERWWILNIYWTQESKEQQIPETYLPE